MARLRNFGQATLALRYSDWIAAALVTLVAIYLHVLFLLNAGGFGGTKSTLCIYPCCRRCQTCGKTCHMIPARF